MGMDILKPSISGYRSNQRFGGEAGARDRRKGRRWGHRRGLGEGAGRGGARHSRLSEEEQEAESHRRTLRGVNLQNKYSFHGKHFRKSRGNTKPSNIMNTRE